jgi:hypothetical protein
MWIMTVQEFVEAQQAKFSTLSTSRQNQLRREAKLVAGHMKDASNFWRGLSANHVLSARRVA